MTPGTETEQALRRLARYTIALRRTLDDALTAAGPRSQVREFLAAGIALTDATARDIGQLLTDQLAPAAA